MSFSHHQHYYWSLVFGLGSMGTLDQAEVVDSGFMLTVYESGPWLGYKFPGNPSIGWIGGGNEQFDFMVTASPRSDLMSATLKPCAGMEALMYIHEQNNRKI